MGTKIKKLIKKIQLKRTTVVILVFIAMAFILIRQIFELQIIQGENYISEFENRITKTGFFRSCQKTETVFPVTSTLYLMKTEITRLM